jgi:D-alanyl-lipoteichoic acid acyltransferase DltB (MBOAT superfamily)
MLFQSPLFLAFLIGVLLLQLVSSLAGRKAVGAVILLVSLLFCMQWNTVDFVVMFLSIVLNYCVSLFLSRDARGKSLLACAIGLNILVLVYFKYAQAATPVLAQWLNININMGQKSIVIPLALSFYTITQIAYLVDCYKNNVKKSDFFSYSFVVLFFPHLISGPIALHRQLFPQLESLETLTPKFRTFAIGISLFAVGLAKKIILADSLDPIVNSVYSGVAATGMVGGVDAWIGSLAYTFQLYFDFSGYTDMALGLSTLFNIRLPLNFNSPYKAYNIQDFWNRWHASLTHFLQTYVYIPMGGNRVGFWRHKFNIMLVMLICGAWHGSGWTYIAWGGMHGLCLIVHSVYNKKFKNLHVSKAYDTVFYRGASRLLTFGVVHVGWVLFRSDSFSTAYAMIKGLLFLGHSDAHLVTALNAALIGLVVSGIVVWLFPSSIEMFSKYNVVLDDVPVAPSNRFNAVLWRPNIISALCCSVLFVVSYLIVVFRVESIKFIYFQF